MQWGGPSDEVVDEERSLKSWASLRDDVRTVRRRLWAFSLRVPHSFLFRRMKTSSTRIYFMSSPPHSRENSVFAVDVRDGSKNLPSFTWLQILPDGFQGSCAPSKEEQLLLERKRMAPSGIAAYQFHESSARFVFSASSILFHCADTDSATEGLNPIEIKTPNTSGARLNAEICPGNSDLVAFVNKGDIWVVHCVSGQEEQLTFSRNVDAKDISSDPISSGIPSYILQEEFNRYHGFWWQPQTSDISDVGIYRLLYEEVDESEVNVVTLLTLPDKESEKYRFPVPGTPNAKSTLKMIELEVRNRMIVNVSRTNLPISLADHFPWAEYLVRAGWTPDGKNVWAQLLDRQQQRLELILIPLLTEGRDAPFYVLISETSESWINVHDALTFLTSPSSSASVKFLWASEETGFRHLYLIESELRASITQPWRSVPHPTLHLSPSLVSKCPLTSGDWEVFDGGVLGVQLYFGVIFFIGLKDSPIERHLYVASLTNPIQVKRLTPLGFSYTAVFNSDCSLVILTFSSTRKPPVCQLYRVEGYSLDSASVNSIHLDPVSYFIPPSEVEGEFPFPDICSYTLSSGQDIYVMTYKPLSYDPRKKYPTILNVYGGPEVQLVYNAFRGTGQLWLYLLVSQGYCVVSIDSRGSHHRGVKFESHIKNRMGTVELKDQVEVLTWLAQEKGFIDMNRVGIYGWSYGGYMSLMGLAHYPHIFKVAVAGAPVTSWELYDTGYTERYMDLPVNNPSGYAQGSVLSYIQQFPDEDDRLLIVHGLVDENVHFIHTAQLVDALVKAGKPHQLQVYPNERHSLRRLEASEHYETMILRFLQKSL